MAIKDYASNRKKYNRAKVNRNTSRKSTRSTRTGKNKALVINFNPMLVMVILVGGLFVAAVLYLEYMKEFTSNNKLSSRLSDKKEITQSNHNSGVKKVTSNISSPDKGSVDSTSNNKISKSPKFEFYHTLPKMEVVVNKPELNNESKHLAKLLKNKINSKDKHGTYVLQLASFKDLKDAEQLRAKLILDGFNVKIQKAILGNNEVWYRVKSNTLANLDLAENMSARLQEHNIKSIILTEKSRS